MRDSENWRSEERRPIWNGRYDGGILEKGYWTGTYSNKISLLWSLIALDRLHNMLVLFDKKMKKRIYRIMNKVG